MFRLLPIRHLDTVLAAACLAGAPALRAQQLDPSMFDAFHWRLIGPSNPAGRAWQIVGVPEDPKTFYVTTAGGGLWKSTNHGTTIVPVFNHEAVASTGAVAVTPGHPSIVWVGTGEPASTRANAWGDGVYRSTDAGATWTNMGLRDTRQISAIVIHPTRPDVVWVAAMGHLWSANAERGVFKTTDGGRTWRRVLFVNDTTGVIDLRADPYNPDVLYAATWQRFRYGGGDMKESGPGSGLWKSIDGGEHWARLHDGLPTDDMGKSNIAVARGNSQIVYAAILTGEPGRPTRTSTQGGIFRSEDGGEHWERVNPLMTSYYYTHLHVDPSDDRTIWMPVFDLWRSTDGGRTLEKHNLRHVHNDLHGMWIDPGDPDHLLLSGDGGVNVSFDRGSTWIQSPLPIGQFYEVEVDNQVPYRVYGGMQDTGHWLGPSRTWDADGITDANWIKLRFNGDGMAIHPDPRDPNIVYMVQEFGNFSRLDLRTWRRRELQPDPAEAERRGLHRFRYGWTPPMIVSRHDPDVLYLGSNYLFRYTGGGADWNVVSPDLTRQQDRSPRGVTDGYHSYGALFSIAESRFDANTLWVGADDGPVHITRNGGRTWIDVTGNFPAGAPTTAVVAEIEPSHFNPATAYLAYDAHKIGDVRPSLYRTDDYGQSWTSVTGNLPTTGSSWVIREDPVNPHLLFAGTEFGVYVTIDGGTHWTRFESNLPTSGVRSMVIQPAARELVVGTFGRAIWVVDIAPLEELTAAVLAEPAHLFAVKPAIRARTRYTYGTTIEQLNGDMFFRGENPPTGTSVWYSLGEPQAEVTIAVTDEDGHAVRTLNGPGTAGLHRVTWDMKPDAPDPTRRPTLSETEAHRWVPVGTYRLTLTAGTISRSRLVDVIDERSGGPPHGRAMQR